MNTRALIIATALTCTAFAGLAQANDTPSSQAVPYHYGMPLNGQSRGPDRADDRRMQSDHR